LRELAGFMREWTAESGVLFIMNDRPDIAALVAADGVHVGQDDLAIAEARRIVGGDKIVGVSTHSVEQLQQAVLDGADYLGVGPVFASTTKNFDELAGLQFVRDAASLTTLPWFGIGGIDAGNVRQFREAGGTRIAVSAAICQSGNAMDATRQLRQALDEGVPNQPFASSSVRTAP
jgi:thiamine-phosphate pyrophosphorylase